MSSRLTPALQDAFDRMAAIQHRHLSAFSSRDPYDRESDAAQQNFERSRAVEELKHQLQAFLRSGLPAGEDRREALRRCQEGIAAIIAGEAALKEGLTDRRLCLKNEMKRLLNGRRALGGYGQAVRNDRPFHVSDKG
ncbi:MAG: hypothetical protein ACOZF0_14945 [Thermodesulfobacteriota bacterium]